MGKENLAFFGENKTSSVTSAACTLTRRAAVPRVSCGSPRGYSCTVQRDALFLFFVCVRCVGMAGICVHVCVSECSLFPCVRCLQQKEERVGGCFCTPGQVNNKVGHPNGYGQVGPPSCALLSVCLFISPSIRQSINLPVHPSVCPSVRPSVHRSVCPSICLTFCLRVGVQVFFVCECALYLCVFA